MKVGDYVRLNAVHVSKTMAKHRSVGVIMGFTRRTNYPRIKWDGVKAIESWYPDYVEVISESPK